jgi:hypothetical protein
MKFLYLFLAFWLNRIHPNRRFIQRLLCNELDRDYNPFLREDKKGAELYSSTLSTAPQIDICPCTGIMMTPVELRIVPESSHTSHMFTRRPRSLHLAASSQLLKMLHILSMSSSTLLPRLLQTIMFHRERQTFEARIMIRVIMKLSSPILKEQSFVSLFHLFRSESRSMRPVCDVPLPHVGRALLSEDSNMKFIHWGMKGMLYIFQLVNPLFPLSEPEILELIFWAFFEQERLQNLDAELFGLPPQSRLSWDNVLNIECTEILQVANQRGLLNRALHFSIQKKREHHEKQRLVERKRQVKWILEGIIYAAVSSCELANLPAKNATQNIVSGSVQDAVPYD